MDFDTAMRAAAKRADRALALTIEEYRAGRLTDEDDITPALVGSLKAHFPGQIGGLTWSASIMRHRSGVAAEESKSGADLVIHVKLDTPSNKYSKGVLIQTKRQDARTKMGKKEQSQLQLQCRTMINISPASFVLNYTKDEARIASATKIQGSTGLELHSLCDWTSYRFFLELFRCPIGDPRIASALFNDLNIPNGVELKGEG